MKNVYIVCRHNRQHTLENHIPPNEKLWRCGPTILVDDLRHSINEDEDKVLIIDLGPLDGRGDKAMTILGKPIMDVRRGPIIL